MKIKLDVNEDAKITALEEAVRSDTPNEVSALYKKLGNVLLTAHILGIACRFRGLEMVKVLIEMVRPSAATGRQSDIGPMSYLDIQRMIWTFSSCFYLARSIKFTSIS